jgi:site-specific DNA-methyltransferase (adenine-specific)
LGIDQEEEFLIISKNRKLEIENPKRAATFRQKIAGFNHKKELELFLAEEPKEEYKTELNLAKKKLCRLTPVNTTTLLSNSEFYRITKKD